MRVLCVDDALPIMEDTAPFVFRKFKIDSLKHFDTVFAYGITVADILKFDNAFFCHDLFPFSVTQSIRRVKACGPERRKQGAQCTQNDT